jgi:tetratricopeptide (TPR) repeat protein
MAEQARTLLVPIFDVERQKLSLGFFKEAIRLDPAYFGGYAGAARATGTLALLSPGGPQKEVLRTEARTFAAKAVELNPTDPWTQSAASWAAMANGNYAEALRLSKLAHELAPDDLHVLEIYGTVALADGDFQLALDLSQPLIASRKKLYRTGNRNVYAVANFYLGNYRETIDALKTAAELGEPVSSGMQAFKTAAYQALGETETAKKQARILMETWPVAIDEVFKRIMRDPAHPEEVGRLLRAAGWSPP